MTCRRQLPPRCSSLRLRRPPRCRRQPRLLRPESGSRLRRALAALEACESTRMGDFDNRREPAVRASRRRPYLRRGGPGRRQARHAFVARRAFRPVPDTQRERSESKRGATLWSRCSRWSCGSRGDRGWRHHRGPAGQALTEPNQLASGPWTSPRGTPVTLELRATVKSCSEGSLALSPRMMPRFPSRRRQ